MSHIQVRDFKININLEPQLSKQDRPFRLSSVRKNAQLPEKWIGNSFKYHWIYLFIYLDERGGFFDVEVDYYDKFLKLTKL